MESEKKTNIKISSIESTLLKNIASIELKVKDLENKFVTRVSLIESDISEIIAKTKSVITETEKRFLSKIKETENSLNQIRSDLGLTKAKINSFKRNDKKVLVLSLSSLIVAFISIVIVFIK